MIRSNDVVVKIAEAMLIDYTAVYFVRAVTNEFTWFSIDPEHHTLKEEESGDDFFKNVKENALKYVYEEDRHIFLEDIQKEQLCMKMSSGTMKNIVFRIMIDGKPVWHALRLLREYRDHTDHFIIGLLNIDNEVKKDQEHDAFSQIAGKLADRYNTIFYVDVETDCFVEFSSTNLYRVLEVPSKGESFFDESMLQTYRVIHEEDRAKLLKVFDKANLKRMLEKKPFVYVDYRIRNGEKLVYVRMTAMYTKDKQHFMFCVEDRSEEMEVVRQLEEAKKQAVRDELTGVKNRNAYGISLKELDLKINSGEISEFALVVCDVNNLKKVNDTLGHSVGDDYIKESCRLICATFNHSPVFRIGGDEFAVVLTGRDFDLRRELVESMNESALESLSAGNSPVLAVGYSEYMPGYDKSTEDVFGRADSAMYEHKKMLKSMTPKE